MQVQQIRTGAGDHERQETRREKKLDISPRFLLSLDVFSISENPPKPSEFKLRAFKYLGCVFLHQFAEMKIFQHHYSHNNKPS